MAIQMVQKNKILIILVLTFSSILSYAQNNILNRKINEVIVSANKAELNKNLTNIFVLDSIEIKNAPVQTIEDLLDFAINVDLRQRGEQGVQTDMSIRGGTFEQCLIMIDGVKINDPQTGHHSMIIPISLDHVKRIEIITGGSSRIFGNYAFSGAINIITKKKINSSITLSKGKNNFENLEINQNFSKNNNNHNLSIIKKKSDGFIEGMDYNIKSFYYNYNKLINNNDISVSLSQINKEFGAFNFYTTRFPNQFEKTKTTLASINFKKYISNITINQKIYLRNNKDEFILFRENPSIYQNFHKTNVLTYDINIIDITKHGSNVYGIELSYDEIKSNRLGGTINSQELNYLLGDKRNNLNFFFEKNLSFDQLSISGGLMFNTNSSYGKEYFPGIDLNYKLYDDFNIFSSFNKSVRYPNYTELYYSSPTNQGNKLLKPEKSNNKEFGVKWTNKIHEIKFTTYKRNGENLIDWILMSGDSIWRTMNLSQAKTTGYELESKIDLNHILKSNLPISKIKINYSKNKTDTSSNGFQSAYVLDYLKSKLSLNINLFLSNNTNISVFTTRQSREGEYIEQGTNEEKKYQPFWKVSSKIFHKFSKNKIFFIEINNVFNKEYLDFGNIPQAKRWYRIGLKINFN